MTKFEIGKEYSMRSAGDYNCIWTYKVIARTENTITITDGKETKKCRINKQLSAFNNTESVKPLGTYSMAPTLRA